MSEDATLAGRFVAAFPVGWLAAVAVTLYGLTTAPAGAGVWHGYAVVLVGLSAGGAATALVAAAVGRLPPPPGTGG